MIYNKCNAFDGVPKSRPRRRVEWLPTRGKLMEWNVTRLLFPHKLFRRPRLKVSFVLRRSAVFETAGAEVVSCVSLPGCDGRARPLLPPTTTTSPPAPSPVAPWEIVWALTHDQSDRFHEAPLGPSCHAWAQDYYSIKSQNCYLFAHLVKWNTTTPLSCRGIMLLLRAPGQHGTFEQMAAYINVIPASLSEKYFVCRCPLVKASWLFPTVCLCLWVCCYQLQSPRGWGVPIKHRHQLTDSHTCLHLLTAPTL